MMKNGADMAGMVAAMTESELGAQNEKSPTAPSLSAGLSAIVPLCGTKAEALVSGSCRAALKRRRFVAETTFAKRTAYPGKLIGGGWEPTRASVKFLGIMRAMVGL